MKTDLKKVMSHLWKAVCSQKSITIFLFICFLIVQLSNILMPIFYGKIFDIIYNTKNISDVLNSLYLQIYIILWLNMINLIAFRIMDYLHMKFELKVDIENYLNNFDYLQSHSYNFFTNNFVWSLTKKLNRYVYAMADLISMFLYDILRFVISVVFITWYIFWQNIYLWFIMLVFFVFIFIFQRYFYKIRYKTNMQANAQDTYISWLLADDISNNFNIKIFWNLKREKNTFEIETSKWAKYWSKYWFLWNIWFWILSFLITILEFLVFYVWIGLWKNGIVWIWFFVVVQIYLFDLFHKLYWAGHVIDKFFKLTADAQEMIEILETPHDIVDVPTAKDISIDKW